MRKLIIFLTVLSLIFMSVAPSVFAVPSYANVGPTTDFQGDVGTTGDFLVNGTKIAVGDVTGVAASGANSDITELTGLTTMLAPQYGGTGVQNNSASTITITGSFPLTFTIGESTGVTLPASGTLVTTGVTTLSSLTTTGTITSGGLGTSATLGAVTLNIASIAENDILYSGGSNVLTRLASNAAASNKFLRTISTGTPSWEAVSFNDIGASTGAAEIDFTTHSIEFSFDDGGELQIGDGGATNYFQVNHAGVASFGGTGRLNIPAADADPAVSAGAFIFDTTVANMTNGNPAIHDGAAIRYFITLAAADIWTTDDDVIVAYDAVDDKFYLKEDTASAGNFILHLMDIDAASVDYVHGTITGAGEGNIDVDGDITNPDYGRIITVTATEGSTGTCTVTGTLADGTTGATDVITLISNDTAVGVEAFVYVSKVRLSDEFISPEEVTIGIGDVIGLQNAISEEADIYMKTVDGVEEYSEISENGNATYNTLDCATITQNEDITIYYHN